MYVRQQPTTVVYTRNDHYITNNASFLQVETNYDFGSIAQCINLSVDLLQQLQCGVCTEGMHTKLTEKFCILAIY